MFQTSKSDVLNSVIISLLVLILVFVWCGFLMLDRKIDKELKRQAEINQTSYITNKEQSENIRVLKTDTQILMNIAVNGDYGMGEEDVGD